MKIIGLGAAGNKIAAQAVETKLVDKGDVVLINTSEKDFPKAMLDRCVLLDSISAGAGKNRAVGKQSALDYIESKNYELNWFDDEDNQCYIITSTSGGTGSGSALVFGNVLKQLGFNVTIIGILGFEEDIQELQNTIEFAQELEFNRDNVIMFIDNKTFLPVARNNKSLAEKMANEEVLKRLIILSGKGIRDSEQNIDSADRMTLINYPGYMTVELCQLTNVKNSADVETSVKEMLDNSASVGLSPTGIYKCTFLNVPDDILNYLDDTETYINNRLGFTQKSFKHIQTPIKGEKPYISLIVAGMKLPINELEEIYERYQEASSKLNKEEDSFFDKVSKMHGVGNEAKFNDMSVLVNRRSALSTPTIEKKKPKIDMSIFKKPGGGFTALRMKNQNNNDDKKDKF